MNHTGTNSKVGKRTRQVFQSASQAVTLLALAILMSGAAYAQLPMAASTQFDLTGFIQEATLNTAGCTARPGLCGGTIKVNGHVVTVPQNMIVILPANALGWEELFNQAPAPYGPAATPVSTGMALADIPAPLTTYEANVVGNRVGDQYIAGLITISQHALNTGAGFINFIDYANGEMRVGGTINNPTTGTRVRINDPLVGSTGTGRCSKGLTPDKRFTVDQDNPTIKSETGYPMCLPRVAPPAAGGAETDPLCPQGNRLKDAVGNYLGTIFMPVPPATPGALPDPRIMAPFEIGDYVIFAGTLVTDAINPTTGPSCTGTGACTATYISAHTITNNIAIYTAPGVDPAYTSVDVTIAGTGGLIVFGAGEAAIRTRFEGMTTDPSRYIHLYGIDFDPATGTGLDRDWGTIGVDQGPPIGAVRGRWRFRPPCTATVPNTFQDKVCTPPPAGTFLPPSREVRARIQGSNPLGTPTANGIISGQYHAPILEYIFPENVPGSPIVPNNFETIDFLAHGGYSTSTGLTAGQLNPWPGVAAPPAGCSFALVNPGGPYTVPSTGAVTLGAGATGTQPISFSWGTPTQGFLSSSTISNPVYTAPALTAPATVTVTVLASNGCGGPPSVATATINITTAQSPVLQPIAPVTVSSGTAVTMTATATDPGNLPLTIKWTQIAPISPVLLNPNPFTSNSLILTAPQLTLAVGAPSIAYTFTVVATNSAGISSVPQLTTLTVKPVPDRITITAAEYRTGKQRLIVNATSSVVSPNVVLTLQPYRTSTGTIFDPVGLGNTFTNNGGGLYIIDLAGAPPPACNATGPYNDPCSIPTITVTSSLGGSAGPVVLTRIRP